MGPGKHVVVGGTGFTGREIVRILLGRGVTVDALTGHPSRPHGFGDSLRVRHLDFGDSSKLVNSLRGADVVYNTYWIRFERGAASFHQAVENSRILFEACAEAGVGKVVHVSITNPSASSPYPYFRGKALVEEALFKSGLCYSVLRPALIYGVGDILLNNIAWILRKYRFFPVPGGGGYRLAPVYVGDIAQAAVNQAYEPGCAVVDAVGPDRLSFRSLVEEVGRGLGAKALVVGTPRIVTEALGKMLSRTLGEPVVTRDELGALMDELLYSEAPPVGDTSLAEWISANRDSLGVRFASELERHYI